MQTVKAKKALPGWREGSVFQVDEASAAVLEKRGDVEFVDDTAVDPTFTTHTGGNGSMAVTQVIAADYPDQPAAPAEGEKGEAAVVVDGDGVAHTDVLPVTKASNKADLVAHAEGKVFGDDGQPLTEAELESLTKADLVDKLGL